MLSSRNKQPSTSYERHRNVETILSIPLPIFVIELENERLLRMKRSCLILFLSFFLSICLYSQAVETTTSVTKTSNSTQEKSVPTSINCIQTDAAGNVTFSWMQVPDPSGTFIEYQVHTTQSGLIASIPSIGTIVYTDPGVTQANSYFIIVNGDTQESSDTISNIFLTVNNPSNGTAVLEWNNPRPNPLPTMSGYYKIYREYPTGVWSFLDSAVYGTTHYIDTVDICSATLNYQILLQNSPCNYTSNIAGDHFVDIITPDIPTISQVTLDTLTNLVTITWNQNNQPDTYGYIIYSVDANGFPVEIDTVWGITNTSYTYSPDVSAGPLSFSIAAFDSCHTASVIPTYQTSAKAQIHTSVFLRNSLDVCNNGITLNWSPYVGWGSGVNYEIWGHIVGQPWQNFGSTHLLTYTLTGVGLANYCFAIKAIALDGRSSFSNRLCFTLTAPSQPAFNYLRVATVSSQQIVLRHYVEMISGVTGVVFQRMNDSGDFEDIGQVSVTSSNLSFTDSDVDVSRYSYTYRAVVLDSCGNYGAISNIAKTILLKITTQDTKMIHYLNWSEYKSFNGPILGYFVYRGFDGYFPQTPLAFLPNTQFSYEDTASQLPASTGKTCYFVSAIEATNVYGFFEVSQSNVVCPILDPIIYIPNSFTPNGDAFNQVFLPEITFFEVLSYDLTIYDRWEHPLFHTNDPTAGWKGEIRSTGKIADPGTYVYLLTVKDGDGKEVTRRGHVNLIK